MATIEKPAVSDFEASHRPLALIADLADEFRIHEIDCCLWKGTFNEGKVSRGEKDIDILVSRRDEPRLLAIISRLGFKAARRYREDPLPGVSDYIGHDSESGKLIHLHLHLTLLAGDKFTNNYLISLVEPYLANSENGTLFRKPCPEFEYILFVIRMILNAKSKGDVLDQARRKELECFHDRIEQDKVASLLANHLPMIAMDLFQACREALTDRPAGFQLAKIRGQMERHLTAYARRSIFSNWMMRFRKRAGKALRTRVLRTPFPKRRMLHGGMTVALIGGDGSGKSTAVATMHEWLSSYFDVKAVHLGRPPKSVRTRVIRAALKIGRGVSLGLRFLRLRRAQADQSDSLNESGLSAMFWRYCLARDRARTYRKAICFANNGGIVIFDRFPVPNVLAMDGPQIEGMIARGDVSSSWSWLAKLEQQWYARLLQPDLTIVLRLRPEIAVQRKPSEEPGFVFERNDAVWNAAWSKSDAHVIEASRPMADVHEEIRNEIWARI